MKFPFVIYIPTILSAFQFSLYTWKNFHLNLSFLFFFFWVFLYLISFFDNSFKGLLLWRSTCCLKLPKKGFLFTISFFFFTRAHHVELLLYTHTRFSSILISIIRNISNSTFVHLIQHSPTIKRGEEWDEFFTLARIIEWNFESCVWQLSHYVSNMFTLENNKIVKCCVGIS